MVFIKVAISVEAAPIPILKPAIPYALERVWRTIRFGYFSNQEIADFLEENSM